MGGQETKIEISDSVTGADTDGRSNRSKARAESGIEIIICPQRVARWMTMLVLTIVVVGTLARVVIYQVAPDPEHKLAHLMQRVDLSHEPSLPNWYSSLALLSSAVLLLVIATHKQRQRAADNIHWYGLSALFFLLALDEAIVIHEISDNTLHEWLGFGGVLYYAWIIPGAIFTLLVGLTFLGFLRQLEARTRWLFVAAGSIFVVGALGFEMVEGVFIETYGLPSLAFTFAQSMAECLEMLGIVLFIFALLDYIQRHIGRIVLRVPTSSGDLGTADNS